ncbi:MAG TPA: isoprenylcysteine carboxylmethyltransferase family protein [Gammaproteobacteria bacterium]|nr:isoprenylcysteine carboxylmethyltransferase family protein [Gammaproteobacteria bacterium]
MEQKRKILPPVYLLLTLASMAALHYAAPLMHLIPPFVSWIGLIFIIAGVAIAATAAFSFKRAGTPIIPFEPSTALVTGGLFRYTRNPMYLGMVSLLTGAGLLFGTLSVWLPVAVFVSIIRNNFILGEERFLEEIFGQQYINYKNKVGRWL